MDIHHKYRNTPYPNKYSKDNVTLITMNCSLMPPQEVSHQANKDNSQTDDTRPQLPGHASSIFSKKQNKGQATFTISLRGLMSTKVLQPASRYVPPIPRITNMVDSHWLVPPIRPWIKNTRFKGMFRPIFTTKFAEHSSGLAGDIKEIKVDVENRSLGQIKADFYRVVEGIDRGVFGVPSAKRSDIERLVELLESQNPTPDPTLNLQKVGGYWKLVYSTITILGSKRTKLGLRDFIMLGDLFQYIDVAKGKAVNVIKFIVRGLKLNGQLTIEASFRVASNSRVDITYDSSSIIPDQLMNMFRKNYDLLLGIFNPDGWLEITYVDDNLRIGRDDNGNIFVLERSEETQT